MGKQVNISEYLDAKLKEMIFIIFEKRYFHSLEASEIYVQRIYDFRKAHIVIIPLKKPLPISGRGWGGAKISQLIPIWAFP